MALVTTVSFSCTLSSSKQRPLCVVERLGRRKKKRKHAGHDAKGPLCEGDRVISMTIAEYQSLARATYLPYGTKFLREFIFADW